MRVIELLNGNEKHYAETNAPNYEIENAIDYKNRAIAYKERNYDSDEEVVAEYLLERGYCFRITKLEKFGW